MKRCHQDIAKNYRWKVLGKVRFWRCTDCPKFKRKACPVGMAYKYAATQIPESCRLRKAEVRGNDLFPDL